MKKLFVPEIPSQLENSGKIIGEWLQENTDPQKLDQLNWASFPYHPEVCFRIAHSANDIWLHYQVSEENILAQEVRTNGDVYKDSCVEFFISTDGEHYYNFEFNCIGTLYVAYGKDRNNRTLLDSRIVERIQVESTLGNKPFEERSGGFDWEMLIRIPLNCFIHDEKLSLEGKKVTGNFYKCGDDTSVPHFITWNAIDTEEPDYHRPEFFGELNFR